MKLPILLLSVALLACAVALSPAPRVGRSGPAPLGPAPSRAALELAALGRRDAAADVLWLRVVQFVGAPGSDVIRYAGLESWVDVILDLAPRFERPYWLSGILLATMPDRAEVADRILARGEAVMPESWELPLYRGFVAYFGLLDPKRAAEHYRRASRFPDAPPYTASFAARLENEARTCGAMRANLASVLQGSRDHGMRALIEGEALGIVLRCEQEALDRAATAFRLDQGRAPSSIHELMTAGFVVERPFAPPGQCWDVGGEAASLVPCPTR